MIWKIQRTTAIPIQNKPLYEFLYAKNDRFGFTEEQDIEILRKLLEASFESELPF